MDEQTVQSRSQNFLQLSVWVITLLISISLLSSDNFAASSSSAVVAILLSLLAIFGGLWIWSIARGRGPNLSTPLDIAMLALLSAVLISAIFSLDPSRSFRSALSWFALVIVYYLAVSAFRSGWQISIFERALLLVLALIILTAYLQLYFWLQSTYFASSGETLASPKLVRISGIINNPNSFAVFVNVGIMIALGLKISLRQRRWPVAILIWLLLLAPLVVLHGSRNGWLSAIFGFACLLTTWSLWRAKGQRIPRSTWLRIGFITLGTALVAFFLVTLIRPATFNLDEVSGYATRSTFWRIAMTTWRENSLTGQGLGTFTTAFLEAVNVPFEPLFASAHSLFFNMTTEMGILGMVAYLLLIGQILLMVRRGYRQRWLTSNSPGLIGAFGVIFAFSLIDYLWIQVQLLAFLLLAALAADLRPKLVTGKNRTGRNKLLAIVLPVIWILVLLAGLVEYRTSRLFESGVAAAAEGNWSTAKNDFAFGERILPYSESSFLFAKGFSEGVLAQKETNHLPTAIETYEQAIQLEPGWSLNYANLAGLHWQSGNSRRAIELMKQAAELAPAVQLYHLNLGLWYEESGQPDEATSAYQRLLSTNKQTGSAQFWRSTPIRTAVWQGSEANKGTNVTEDLELAYSALDSSDPELALTHLSQVLDQQPDLPAALIAQGVAHLYSGDTQAADEAWQMAASRGVSYQSNSQLWRTLLTDNPEQETLSLLAEMTRPSIFEPKSHDLSTYNRAVFVRPGLPAEILPQLQCFSLPLELDRQLTWLQSWAEHEDYLDLTKGLDYLKDKDADGLRPCFIRPELAPEEALGNLPGLQE